MKDDVLYCLLPCKLAYLMKKDEDINVVSNSHRDVIGAVLYYDQVDFNAEPPWEPS